MILLPEISWYKSASQVARVMTETWTRDHIFCPNCWNTISEFENNRPVADFYCKNCMEEFELKSKKSQSLGNIVPDGAYWKMIERLESSTNPSFFFLTYTPRREISNFLVIPKHFIQTKNIIRAPRILKDRGEYIMCNISLVGIPESGKIFYIENWVQKSEKQVLETWKKTTFLRESSNIQTKGWLLDTMRCIDMIGKKEFTIADIYNFTTILKEKHPENNNIEAKLRQQLQVLRDKWYLEFSGRGVYRVL